MKSPGSRCRSRLAVGLVCLGLGIVPRCEDSRPRFRELEFGYFVHPGALDAGTPGQLRAGVYVGPDGCWHLGGTSFERHGNRLVLSGYAFADPGPAICTLARVYEALTLTIPPLEPGDYVIEAGNLSDTLGVRSPAPRPAGVHFAAHGSVWSAGSACLLFGTSYPGSEEISGMVEPGTLPEPVSRMGVTLVGSVAGRDSCAGSERNLIRVRAYEWEGTVLPGSLPEGEAAPD